MRYSVLVLFCSWFSGEERGEFPVKGDEVLCVFPSLEFVLWDFMVRYVDRFFSFLFCVLWAVLTVDRMEGSAQPRRT